MAGNKEIAFHDRLVATLCKLISGAPWIQPSRNLREIVRSERLAVLNELTHLHHAESGEDAEIHEDPAVVGRWKQWKIR